MLDTETTDVARRRAVPGILLFVLALVLTACGGTDTGSSEDTGGQGGTTTASSSAERYVLPGEAVYPEGVAYRPETGDFFVGSTTDGTIFRGNVEGGGGEAEVFLDPGSDGHETAIGMKDDERGQLFIAGGDTGRIFVYDVASGELVRALDTSSSEMTFINDVVISPNGDAYFTDSIRPTLFRVPSSNGGVGDAESWLDFEGPP